ncbi:MAG: HDOD domain-containing protein [Betaproteobacteria bacterium]|nr:HDOD domain-containing protein [Betaproteobacteria bacterium]
MEPVSQNIDRFEIIRNLGGDAQSRVYLAYDPNLQREVAIKTLHVAETTNRQDEIQALIRESRTVSQLRHPNIVPIFEAGEYEGDPYLVFEYIKGQTLADLLEKRKALPVSEALDIIGPVLDALAHAHQNGIIHRDLKPSNILIPQDEPPRVMDFGIAEHIDSPDGENPLMGTPAYMAPEYINSRTISEKNDIFAAGLILYEMLVGHQAVRGDDINEIMQRIAAGPIAPPINDEAPIDDKLANIILKAIAFDPLDRYASAGEMEEALHAYSQAEEDEDLHPSGESRQGTLDFLLRRMRHKSDFPALSESVSAINRITSSEMESASKLANSILRDVALTNKILKLVNAAFYKSYGGGTISTISRAVIILGFDAVRNIAITLILFEHLQNKSHAEQLKDEFVRALFSAILAKRISAGQGAKDPEEAFICAMFHNLGRLLAMFYFPEEAIAVTRVMEQKGCSEDAASNQVLGISYQDLGIGIAKVWGFPEQIVHSMRKLPPDSVPRPRSPMDQLRIISGFSSELCTTIANTPRENRLKEIRKLSGRFGDHMPVAEKQVPHTLDKSLEEITQYASTVRVSLTQSQFGKQLAIWAGHPEIEEKVEETAALDLNTLVLSTVQEFKSKPTTSLDMDEASAEPVTPQTRLTAGIQDISNSLVIDGCSLNDILRMILETMYRGMGFQRVMLCIKDGKQNVMQGRFGFGLEITQTAKNFRIPLAYTPDVFHAAMSRGVDILISDINDPKIRPHIPDWYRKNIAAQTFALFPLNIKNVPVALIYVDKAQAGDIRIPDAELNLLRTLRNQAIMAIKQAL